MATSFARLSAGACAWQACCVMPATCPVGLSRILVAVVGAGHVPGIVGAWEKVRFSCCAVALVHTTRCCITAHDVATQSAAVGTGQCSVTQTACLRIASGSTQRESVSIFPSIDLSIDRSIHRSICLSVYLCIYVSIYLSIHPSIYL